MEQTETPASANPAVNDSGPSISGDASLVRFKLERADLMAMGVIAAALAAVFWRVIFTSDMFFYRDVYNFSYPHAKFIHDMVRQGHLPYWNPYLHYGEPVLADPNFLFFYPDTLLLVLLPVSLAYKLHYLLHFFIAALGAYWLGRRFSQSRPAALFAALSFGLSGPVLSLGNFYNEAACAAWIPWALLLTDRVVENRTRRSWIVLTLVFTLQFLAAEPFTLMATFALCFFYAIWRSLRDHRQNDSEPLPAPVGIRSLARRLDWRLIGGFILAGVLVLAISAASLLPSLDLLAHSQRGATGMRYTQITHWSFHPLYLLEFVLPGFFGSTMSGPTLWSIVLSTRSEPYFPSCFVGFVPLLFALAGWALGHDRRRRFVTWSGWVLLTLSFGSLTPLFALAYLGVPPLSLVRFPVKLLTLVVLVIALSAGWGVDALRGLCYAQITKANPKAPADRPARRARQRLLYPLLTMVAVVMAVWVVSLVRPRLIASSGTWILVHTNAFFRPGESYRLTPSEVGDAARYLVGHVRLEFTVLIGLGLGAAVWIGMLLGGRSSPRLGKASLAIIAVVGLCQVVLDNYHANPTVPKIFYAYRPPLLDQVPAGNQPYRFCHILHSPVVPTGSTDVEAFLNFDSIPGAEHFSAAARGAFHNRLTLRDGSLLTDTDTVLNNDVDLAFPPYLFDFWYFAIRQAPNQAQSDCLIGRTNVEYLIRSEPKPNASMRLVGRVFDGSAKPVSLFQNLCFLPRAFVANSALNEENSFDTLSRLSAPDFDPYGQVILAQDPGGQATPEAGIGPRSALPGISESGGGNGEIKTLEEQPNRVSLSARLSRPGYVVLLDRFDPNWRGTVDGREVKVYRANQLFRAIRVEAGEHVVRFDYQQRGLAAGVIISLATLLGLAAAWWRKGCDSARPAVDQKGVEIGRL